MEIATCFDATPSEELPTAGVLIASFHALAARGRPVAAFPSIHENTPSMNTYVILFRQGPRPLTDDEIQRRAQETSVWARSVTAAGHTLDPRILAAESRLCPPASETAAPATGPAVIALLFLEARDLDEATRVAETHPGRRYGSTLEVRPWTAPVRLAQPQPDAVPAR